MALPKKHLLIPIIIVIFLASAVIIAKNTFFASHPNLPPTLQNLTSQPPSISNQLNLKQKLAQLLIIGLPGKELDSNTKQLIQKHGLGGILLLQKNIESEEQLKKLITDIKTATGKNPTLPEPFMAIDQEGGLVNRLPWLNNATAAADIDNFTSAHQIASQRARNLKELGVTLNFAPVIEPSINAQSYITKTRRGFTGDLDQVEDFALATLKACNQEQLLCIPKHIPLGLGQTPNDPHHSLPEIQDTQDQVLNQLNSFKTLLDFAPAIMVTHLSYPVIDPDYPTSISPTFIQNIIRQQLNFQKPLITDDLSMAAINNSYTLEESASLALQAGNNLLIISVTAEDIEPLLNHLADQVNQGNISLDHINSSASQVIKLKKDYQ